ncbi:MAG TPA: alpha/beta fold hydrolase, partial [Pseudolabrys sp.]|nr:alpha/beta fold hydrolase [Pseudolabrys sp.]
MALTLRRTGTVRFDRRVEIFLRIFCSGRAGDKYNLYQTDMASDAMAAFEQFEAISIRGEEADIFLRRAGSGPAVLLLHGFPQTHLMWRDIAPLLAQHFTVICADLHGYGQTGSPAS